MSSPVDICNLALGHLGQDARISSITPSDGSAEADHCVRFYPIARDAMLEANAWSFATTRVSPAQLSLTLPGWSYAYAVPNQCLRPLAILKPGALDDNQTEDFYTEMDITTGNKVIYTNIYTPVLKFIYRVEDTTKYSGLFAMALARLLASFLAGPILHDVQRAKDEYKIWLAEKATAAVADANTQQTSYYKNATPGGIAARA